MPTRNQICKAIKERTGWDVSLAGSAQEGCYHFYSDDPETADKLANWFETTVYVCYINSLTLDQWVGEFETLLEANHEY